MTFLINQNQRKLQGLINGLPSSLENKIEVGRTSLYEYKYSLQRRPSVTQKKAGRKMHTLLLEGHSEMWQEC